MPAEAVRDALGAAGGTLAMLTPHPAGWMPWLGEAGSWAGSAAAPAQPQPSRSVCERWAGGHACLDGRQLQPVGPAAPL